MIFSDLARDGGIVKKTIFSKKKKTDDPFYYEKQYKLKLSKSFSPMQHPNRDYERIR